MRETFDGMRAYHQSEIAHTNHAVTSLLAMAGAVGVVAVALLFPQHQVSHLSTIAWALFGAILLLSVTVALTTHIKIMGDHNSYRALGAEYMRSAEALGLYEAHTDGRIHHDAIKQSRTIGRGPGYRRTLVILWSFSAILIVVTLAFAVAAPSLSTP